MTRGKLRNLHWGSSRDPSAAKRYQAPGSKLQRQSHESFTPFHVQCAEMINSTYCRGHVQDGWTTPPWTEARGLDWILRKPSGEFVLALFTTRSKSHFSKAQALWEDTCLCHIQLLRVTKREKTLFEKHSRLLHSTSNLSDLSLVIRYRFYDPTLPYPSVPAHVLCVMGGVEKLLWYEAQPTVKRLTESLMKSFRTAWKW
jgi:hypothetical protein